MNESRQPNILVVDDNPDNLRLLVEILKGMNFTVRPAKNSQTALNSAISNPPDLILLDIIMPGIDGYETCRRLKAVAGTRDIPVIFLSALDDSFLKIICRKETGKSFSAFFNPFWLGKLQNPKACWVMLSNLQKKAALH